MKTNKNLLLVATAALSLGIVGVTGAHADNTVQTINKKLTHAVDKAGHATAYSTHKDQEQTSVATHKALGKNSVVTKGKGKKEKAYVVHPGGTKTKIPVSQAK